MKRFLSFALILTSFSSLRSQDISNTTWKTYNPSLIDTLTVEIGTDSILQYIEPDSILVSSYYVQNVDTVTLVDAAGPLACPSADTGLYTFTISGDTLTVNLLTDPCFQRSVVYDGVKLWRESTGIASSEQKNLGIRLYPNPSRGPITIESEKELQLTIINISGQMIDQRRINRGQNLIELKAGAYIFQFVDDRNVETKKILVQ